MYMYVCMYICMCVCVCNVLNDIGAEQQALLQCGDGVRATARRTAAAAASSRRRRRRRVRCGRRHAALCRLQRVARLNNLHRLMTCHCAR